TMKRFPSRCASAIQIDLAKRVIERLAGVAAGTNGYGKHTPQTKIGSQADCRSTLRTYNRLLLRIHGKNNAVHRNTQVKRRNKGTRLTRIEYLSRYSPLPFLLPFYGKSAAKFLTI